MISMYVRIRKETINLNVTKFSSVLSILVTISLYIQAFLGWKTGSPDFGFLAVITQTLYIGR
jgi:hypothetical protein